MSLSRQEGLQGADTGAATPTINLPEILPHVSTKEGFDKLYEEYQRRRLERGAVGIRKNCETLAGFIKEAWHVLEPATPLIWGWHIDAICNCLEAVTRGEYNRLLINIPPGFMKSLLVSVLWPAWEWGPAGLPHLRYIATSYSENFTKRDNRRMRDLVASEWYRTLWPTVRLKRAGEMSFENESTGGREARPFPSLTGGRGHRVLIDDPHSTETAESEAERETSLRIFRESVPTRMEDPEKSAVVLIMQRLHQRDISGFILEHDDRMGYQTLILPMEFEPERVEESTIDADLRTKPGELLFPARFPRTVVDRDKKIMGSHAVAGQFQQRPAPRGGGMFKRHWFEIVPAAPKVVRKAIRWWDLAGTAASAKNPNPDWTCGVLMVRDADGVFYVVDVQRLRGSDLDVERLIRQTAAIDATRYARICQIIPEDPGSAGKYVANAMVRALAGYTVRKGKEDNRNNKEVRAEPFAAQCEANNVKLVQATWNEAYLDELSMFPAGSHDDQVDASSGSFKELTMRKDITQGPLKGLY